MVFLLALIAVGGLAFGGIFDPSWLTITLTGTSLSFAAAAGTTTTGTATTETMKDSSANLPLSTISQKITEMKPSAYPLDTILRKIGEPVKTESWDYKWYNIDQRAIQDTVKTTLSSTGTTSASSQIFELAVNNVVNWGVDDNLIFLTEAGVQITNTAGAAIVANIVAKNSAQNTITLLALNGNGTNSRDLPELAAGVQLVCIGNAKAEKDAQTTPYQAYPQDTFNYCQIHMAQVEQSFYEKIHKKEVNWSYNDYRAQSIYDMRRKAELTSLWGVKGKFYDPVGDDYKYMSDGITRLITKGLEYSGSSITNDTFAGWGKDIFTGNSGSDKRIMFVGGNLMKSLLSVPTITKQIEAKQTEVVWGIRFNKIDTGFGELLVKYHNLFDVSGYADNGLVLDVNYLEKVNFKEMSTRELSLKDSGQKNVQATLIEEAFCVATRYPDLHAIITKAAPVEVPAG
jgi:hypothetical protein